MASLKEITKLRFPAAEIRWTQRALNGTYLPFRELSSWPKQYQSSNSWEQGKDAKDQARKLSAWGRSAPSTIKIQWTAAGRQEAVVDGRGWLSTGNGGNRMETSRSEMKEEISDKAWKLDLGRATFAKYYKINGTLLGGRRGRVRSGARLRSEPIIAVSIVSGAPAALISLRVIS